MQHRALQWSYMYNIINFYSASMLHSYRSTLHSKNFWKVFTMRLMITMKPYTMCPTSATSSKDHFYEGPEKYTPWNIIMVKNYKLLWLHVEMLLVPPFIIFAAKQLNPL